jgi:hypothetical protein
MIDPSHPCDSRSVHRHLRVPTAFLTLFCLACVAPKADDASDEAGTDTSDSDTGTSDTGSGTDEIGESDSGSGDPETGTGTDDTETGTGDPGDTDTGPDATPCECIPDDDFDRVDTPSAPTCGETLCPTIEVGDDDVVMNPEAVDCALMALRDRTPGIITWHYSINAGQYSDTGYLLIVEDGRAIQRWWGAEDKSYTIDAALLGELQTAAYFDDCLAEPEAIMRYHCVRSELAAIDVVCHEGETF